MSSMEKEPPSDFEWEWEYDECQTEDFYFTLDLPGSLERPSKRRKTNAQHESLEATAESTGTHYITNGNTGQQRQTGLQKNEHIRFQGLHTTTPSVDYGDQRYECRWTTDLGTQFHVSRPGLVTKSYRAGRAVDVVGLSRVRLTGSHVTSDPSDAASDNGKSEGQAIVVDDDEDKEDGHENSPRGDPRSPFLKRVAEIQRRKARQAVNGAHGSQSATSPLPSTAAPSRLESTTSTPHVQNASAFVRAQKQQAQVVRSAKESNQHGDKQATPTIRTPPRAEQNAAEGTDHGSSQDGPVEAAQNTKTVEAAPA